jgi:hypothetical protein
MAKSRKMSYDEQRLVSVDRADADQAPKPKRMPPLRLVGLRGRPMACNAHASHVAVGSVTNTVGLGVARFLRWVAQTECSSRRGVERSRTISSHRPRLRPPHLFNNASRVFYDWAVLETVWKTSCCLGSRMTPETTWKRKSQHGLRIRSTS